MSRLRNALSTYNHPAHVGLVDALTYFVLSVTTLVGINSLQNALAAPGSVYTIDYAPFLALLGATALTYGLVSALFSHTIQRSGATRSMRRTIVGTAAVIIGATGIVWLVVAAVWVPVTDPLEICAIAGVFGLFTAPMGYRLYGFVLPEVVLSINGIDVPLTQEPSTGMTADGMLVDWNPDSKKK